MSSHDATAAHERERRDEIQRAVLETVRASKALEPAELVAKVASELGKPEAEVVGAVNRLLLRRELASTNERLISAKPTRRARRTTSAA